MGGIGIRTHVYIDGFNLYYGALKGRAHKWLNVVELAKQLVPSTCSIDRVKYFTARVSGAADPGAPRRQQQYLTALRTLPEVEIHFGRFLAKTVWRPVVNFPVGGATIHSAAPANLENGTHQVTGGTLANNARLVVDGYPPRGGKRRWNKPGRPLSDALVVECHTMEEKGSDVNLAAHLLNDAWKGVFDAAVVISNDTDLCAPIEMVAAERGLPVYVACPSPAGMSKELAAVATHKRHIRPGMLAAAQFDDPILPSGLAKPAGW